VPHVQGKGPVGPMSTAPAMQAESVVLATRPAVSLRLCVSASLLPASFPRRSLRSTNNSSPQLQFVYNAARYSILSPLRNSLRSDVTPKVTRGDQTDTSTARHHRIRPERHESPPSVNQTDGDDRHLQHDLLRLLLRPDLGLHRTHHARPSQSSEGARGRSSGADVGGL
jgi:hypothetical protein